jgi:threonine aldolase
MNSMRTFMSDNASGVHPNIMDALVHVNQDHAIPYGGDTYTKSAEEQMKKAFACKNLGVFFVVNGTGANVVANSAFLRSYEAIITSDIAHIYDSETGAFENFTGAKILPVKNKAGKITPKEIMQYTEFSGNPHHSQPKVVSISQLTELGTTYTCEEIKDLADFSHSQGWYLHVDGARLSNALAGEQTTLKEMITDTGVDILSFGGTKNGLMFGEAIICFNPEISERLPYLRKHGNQLLSKMRYVSAQFYTYLQSNLYMKNAEYANAMANSLGHILKNLKGIEIAFPIDGNMIFVTCSEEILKSAVEHNLGCEVIYDKKYLRLVTSFDTTAQDIHRLVDKIG